ncbi:uncharacterized protein LOC126318595 [Schistocerca gregaria]|uniref:uncharacterized protein LOC126318595 n=1 Tax=Schistocerca gregaria TaxID=7010 RepID=UPI00211DABCB|nr:uncharacterized protein LOC126318595 [Schistocerca gregaria]
MKGAASGNQLVSANPYGIQPWGNYYCEEKPVEIRTKSLGNFCVLEDQIILEQILVHLLAADLARLSRVSRVFYVFCYYDKIWRDLTLESFGGDWTFRSTWRETYICRARGRVLHGDPAHWRAVPMRVDHFYSDYMHDEWECAVTDPRIWESCCAENIERCANPSPEEFDLRYGRPNLPVVMTGVVEGWPAWESWTREKLKGRFPEKGQTFQVGSVSLPLCEYFDYCDKTRDETPLYLFDGRFGEKYPELLEDYRVPECFGKDYFSLLDEEVRPSYRWILIGPARSGSTFHKDPNSTSAWNALIRGKKLWIMYPPEVVPPEVYPSRDQAEVTTPVSVMEWMVRFFKKAQRRTDAYKICIQRPGEIVYIPNGWWHQVVNLEECVAVTQNVVCDNNLRNVVRFLERKRNRVYWAFREAMEREHSEKWEEAAGRIFFFACVGGTVR